MVWISVDFMKPDENQYVLAFIDGCFVNVAQYRDNVFFDIVKDIDGTFFETISRDVTHWMPLPEPPKE